MISLLSGQLRFSQLSIFKCDAQVARGLQNRPARSASEKNHIIPLLLGLFGQIVSCWLLVPEVPSSISTELGFLLPFAKRSESRGDCSSAIQHAGREIRLELYLDLFASTVTSFQLLPSEEQRSFVR